jgi:hypothetical protein
MKDFMLRRRRMKKSHYRLVCLSFLVILLLDSPSSLAQGDLLIYPRRIVFEGSKRSQEINLANSGKDTARYILSVLQIRMKEDGAFEPITEPDPGQNFADKYFRIFPRNVVLAPNEAQTIKIQLTNTGELHPGEYRSHLYIRAEGEKRPLGEEEPPKDSTTISVKLVAVFGISIPVIIRSGENTSAVSLSDVSFHRAKDTVPAVKFTFNRSGNMSAYGDISVDYISPEGKATRVGTAKGIAVYTPTAKRNFRLELSQAPPGVDYHKGSLHLTYSYDAAKNEKLAEERIVLR